jgi:hypothetical protein
MKLNFLTNRLRGNVDKSATPSSAAISWRVKVHLSSFAYKRKLAHKLKILPIRSIVWFVLRVFSATGVCGGDEEPYGKGDQNQNKTHRHHFPILRCDECANGDSAYQYDDDRDP